MFSIEYAVRSLFMRGDARSVPILQCTLTILLETDHPVGESPWTPNSDFSVSSQSLTRTKVHVHVS